MIHKCAASFAALSIGIPVPFHICHKTAFMTELYKEWTSGVNRTYETLMWGNEIFMEY